MKLVASNQNDAGPSRSPTFRVVENNLSDGQLEMLRIFDDLKLAVINNRVKYLAIATLTVGDDDESYGSTYSVGDINLRSLGIVDVLHRRAVEFWEENAEFVPDDLFDGPHEGD